MPRPSLLQQRFLLGVIFSHLVSIAEVPGDDFLECNVMFIVVCPICPQGPIRQSGSAIILSSVDKEEITDEKIAKMHLPDVSQMMPFKPTAGTS